MQCKYKTIQNGQCEAFAMKNNDFCFTHNPEVKEQHLKAAAKGGTATRDIGNILLPEIQINQPADVVVLLQQTINKVRAVRQDGTMDIRTANCIGYLAGQLIKAIEVSDLESRLGLIEQVIFERKSLIVKHENIHR